MKLTRARVINYKSIDDSSWVRVDDVTALVGKNESGRRHFFKLLEKLILFRVKKILFRLEITLEKGTSNIKRFMIRIHARQHRQNLS